MNISFRNYPVDVILCLLWIFMLIPISQMDTGDPLRIVLGLPFIVFIPGYILVSALFPTKKTERGLNIVERVALGIGLSLIIVALIGVGLNYTPIGIQPISSSFFLGLFTICIGAIAIYRWFKTAPDDRFTPFLHVSLKKPEDTIDKALIVILIVVIIITLATFVYVAITSKPVKTYTEFYLLGPDGRVLDYPKDLNKGENATVSIGITNHEDLTMEYTIEIWLLNKTTYGDGVTNTTSINNAWFLEKINITLPPNYMGNEGSWKSQWSYNYTFSINRIGKDLKLMFLLFTTPTENYNYNKDYKTIFNQKIKNAYEELHLSINVI
jgi:uncharacterized membrane protein